MSCMSPMAPAREMVGLPFVTAQPALSAWMTASIHANGMPDRSAASRMADCHGAVPQKIRPVGGENIAAQEAEDTGEQPPCDEQIPTHRHVQSGIARPMMALATTGPKYRLS